MTQSTTVVHIPVWLMSIFVVAIIGMFGSAIWTGVEMYDALGTLTDRVDRMSSRGYMTAGAFNAQIKSRDAQISDLYARYRDLRQQQRRYHGRSDAEWHPPMPVPERSSMMMRIAAHESRTDEIAAR